MLSTNTIIAIDMGHTLSGGDYGAVGVKAESLLTREVGKLVIAKLNQLGYRTVDCTLDNASTVGQSLGYRVNKANYARAGLYVSIHFNCFNSIANGVEIWTYAGKQLEQAKAALNNLVNLGFTNRGIKDGSNLYVLKYTSMKSMLVECCFCDSSKDMNIFSAERVANAIVQGITGREIQSSNNPATEVSNVPKIDHSIPDQEGVVPLPGGLGYLQVLPGRDRVDWHLDKYNYITIQDSEKEGNRIVLTTRTKGSKVLL